MATPIPAKAVLEFTPRPRTLPREPVEYTCWRNMNNRCRNPNNPAFKNYGGRGITVCDRWKSSYENFLADMGPRPSPAHSIERNDNDLGYSPSNCRWATKAEQFANRRCTMRVELAGQTFPLRDVCAFIGAPFEPVRGRLRLGWHLSRAISEPRMVRGIERPIFRIPSRSMPNGDLGQPKGRPRAAA